MNENIALLFFSFLYTTRTTRTFEKGTYIVIVVVIIANITMKDDNVTEEEEDDVSVGVSSIVVGDGASVGVSSIIGQKVLDCRRLWSG